MNQETEENNDYKVVYLTDTHMYDWEDMFFESSAQRVAFAVREILEEHNTRGRIDLVVMPGDVVNNWLYEYEADTFDMDPNINRGIVYGGWGDFELDGVTYTSKYKGVSYPAGSSGTTNDALGVLRILSFLELLQPLKDAGIPVICASGNHDCYNDSIWEMAFEFNQMDGYLGGVSKYAGDTEGNLLIPTYEIRDGVFSFVTKTVLKTDPDYEKYKKGYGTEYAFALGNTAYQVYNIYHPKTNSQTNGFGSSASGRNWLQTPITEHSVKTLDRLTRAYDEIYIVLHTIYGVNGNEKALTDYIIETNAKNPGQIVAVMDGDSHNERTQPNVKGTGVYALTCGYLGVPMYEKQKDFKEYPFSYRIVEKTGDDIISYTVLFEHDYPAYTFTRSSKAEISAFYQPYTRREAVKIN